MSRGSADKVLLGRRRVDKTQFQVVNVSLVVVKVLVACGVAVLHLQLLCVDHGRVDGSVSGPVELAQVNLEAKQNLISTFQNSTPFCGRCCVSPKFLLWQTTNLKFGQNLFIVPTFYTVHT